MYYWGWKIPGGKLFIDYPRPNIKLDKCLQSYEDEYQQRKKF
jgi:hypothetical protein